jgi:hypothetical protein
MIKSFLTGFITGAVVMGVYGRQIAEYIEDNTFTLRMKAAEGLGAVAQGVDSVRDTVETVKGRVEDGFGRAGG